jgi:hypothetical protein
MGMTCALYRATESEIDRLIKEPTAIGSFIDPDDGSAPRVRTVRPKGLSGLILRLLPITMTEVTSEPAEGAPVPAEDPDRSIDIEKAWHGLHFLFTGTADEGEEPTCYLVRGGEDLDDEGQTRALRPHQVRRFADYLSALTSAELARRYDPARMAKLEIYPDRIWMRPAPAGDSPLEWLLECFAELREFMGRAAATDHGVIIHVA